MVNTLEGEKRKTGKLSIKMLKYSFIIKENAFLITQAKHIIPLQIHNANHHAAMLFLFVKK
jgi:hypothetical protein